MAFFRRRNRADGYTIVDNFCLQDANLSFAETGLMAYFLSLPADWEIKQSQLENAKTDGRDKVRSLFKTLINKGYLVKKESRDVKGKFNVDYDIYERPTELNFEVIHSESHRDGFTDTVKPQADSHPLQITNTKFVNNKINNNIHTCEDVSFKNLKRSRVELFQIVTTRYKDMLTSITEPKQQEVANEVINVMVDLIYYAEHQGFYKANKKQYSKKEIAQLLVKLDDDALVSIIGSVVFNPEPIKKRNRYILAALLKQAEASDNKATNNKSLLEIDGARYLPNYLEASA